MTTATNSFTPANSTGFSAKVAGVAYAVAATVFGINLRESLDVESSSDKADAAYTWGM
ncbi:hypothetical protein BCF11_4974 [Collimonas sp. PA-H2]|uniref:hypothetical protein n=1 Tax=Collimonas sp. PA-H2 TaxID=1881062 RepID=UPI000C014284|nr:hypothetical protein [Collimonas sp. PA-H2]PFH12490.1 hypothetical protein BCF11_4974 [Collimonas sp. PA-H2]